MYAMIKTGGKQYRVQKGDIIDVELLGQDPGAEIKFLEVLTVWEGDHVHVGLPTLKGFSVIGELIGDVKGEKVIAMKYKRRKQYRRTFGHRQHYSRVKITDIHTEKKSAKHGQHHKGQSDGA